MKQTEKERNQKLVLCALLSAVTFAVTYFIPPVPLPFGYANLGDTIVLLSAFIIGGLWGSVAGGLGSALADLFLGYGIYAPATFIIKALMGFVAFLFFRKAKKIANPKNTLYYFLGCICAELLMVSGYFIFELCLYSTGAFASLAGNVLQGTVNTLVATVLLYTLKNNKTISKYL